MAKRRRTCQIALTLLGLFLLGTVAVLTTVSFYLRIDPAAYLSEDEVAADTAANVSERIPRILHQTWKTETLPERWRDVAQHCRDTMPDYEYRLWTDAGSRAFLAEHYPWFLPTFDAYPYPIQRADAIRYFILHRFGGVYLDLDVGCTRRLDPLLRYPVVLPKTIPVGVSNDLMFAEPAHPFMDQTIHNLVTFDHSWVLNYPTVMFSTGPMFLSAQYGLYAAAHPRQVRVLPKALYGKNARPDEAPNSFFTHYYGSSWHADDAGFITFLGKWGKLLMGIGLAVLLVGAARLIWLRHVQASGRRRRLFGYYDIILPRVIHRNGQFHFDLGSFSLSTQLPTPATLSPASSPPSSPNLRAALLPGYESDQSSEDTPRPFGASAANMFNNASAWVRAPWSRQDSRLPRPGRRRHRSTLFFLPAIFTPSSSNRVRIHSPDEPETEIPLTGALSSRLSTRAPYKSRPNSSEILFSVDDDENVREGRLPSPVISRSNSSRQLPTMSIPGHAGPAPPPYDPRDRVSHTS